MNPDDPRIKALLAALGLTPAPEEAPKIHDISGPSGPGPIPDPGTTQGRFEQLRRSPFADTLRSLSGSPSAIVNTTTPMASGALGWYQPHRDRNDNLVNDTLSVTPDALKGYFNPVGRPPREDRYAVTDQPEYVLAHEFGHRDRAASVDPASGPSQRITTQDSTYRAQMDSLFANPARHETADNYWRASGNEHYAEAFANAVTFLRRTSAMRPGFDTPTATRELAAQAERDVPGTKAMIADLLSRPAFAKHPLNQSFGPLAPADMTRVARRP